MDRLAYEVQRDVFIRLRDRIVELEQARDSLLVEIARLQRRVKTTQEREARHRKRAGVRQWTHHRRCVGCGVTADRRTPGCKACRGRHWKRALKAAA